MFAVDDTFVSVMMMDMQSIFVEVRVLEVDGDWIRIMARTPLAWPRREARVYAPNFSWIPGTINESDE